MVFMMNCTGFISSCRSVSLVLIICLVIVICDATQQTPTSTSIKLSITIKTTPGMIIWLDGLRYGAVPANSELKIRNLRSGTHTIRARLKGKHEITQLLTLTTGASRTVQLSPTLPAAEAELHFQTAEELRERGDHTAAIEEYRQAIRLHSSSAVARVGLARSLMVTEEYEDAVTEARRALRNAGKPFPEAHTIIANTRRAQGLYDEALASYRTALLQAHDFSPEAHTGLALTCQELNRAEEAINHFRLAAAQSNETEPVIYFLLGGLLEREQRTKEAIAAYENYLRLEPQGRNTAAVRSVLKQLLRQEPQ